MDEAGLPGFYFSLWFGYGLPKARWVIARLMRRREHGGRAIDAQKIAERSMEIPPQAQQTPEALGTFHRAEIEKWWPIIKAAGINGD